jgi:hypothetical protein
MHRRVGKFVFIVAGSFVAVACASVPPAGEAVSSVPGLTACEDPRPQVCTLQYQPVCGFASAGEFKTYSNACSACSDQKVTGHRPGACE